MSGPRPHWTITQAVERTTASKSTIIRYRKDDKLPGAYLDSKNTWRYPVEDFVALGILAQGSPVEKEAEHPDPQSLNRVSTQPEHPVKESVDTLSNEKDQEIAELTLQLAVEREKTAGLLRELGRVEQALENSEKHANIFQRMLEAPKAEQVMTTPEPQSTQGLNTQHEQVTTTSVTTPKKRWFARRQPSN